MDAYLNLVRLLREANLIDEGINGRDLQLSNSKAEGFFQALRAFLIDARW